MSALNIGAAGHETAAMPALRLVEGLPPGDPAGAAGDPAGDAGAASVLFSTLAWFRLIAQTALPATSRAVHLLREGSSGATPCLPFILDSRGGPRRIEALSNFYSPVFEPAASAADVPGLTADFARFAARSGIDVVDLHPLDVDSPLFSEAKRALREAGYWVDHYFCFGNWYLEVAGRSFDEYFSTLTSNIRKNAARRVRKLEAQGMEIRILTRRSPELEQAIRDFEAVYGLSWRNQAEPYPHFVPELCRMAADHGWLRLGVLALAGKVVAAQIWLVKDGAASIFKLAYIEEYAKLAAGTVLTTELMRQVIDVDRVNIVDYLSGDDAYKKDWMSHRRERRGIVAFNRRRWRGIVAALRHHGVKLARAWVRQVREFRRKSSPEPVQGTSNIGDNREH